MVEAKKRFPRCVKILAGIFLVVFLVWVWLDHAFRAPEVVTELQKLQQDANTNLGADQASKTSVVSLKSGGTAQHPNLPDGNIAIDCSTPDIATKRIDDWIDESFGAELTELVMSGALTYADSHPMSLRENWTTPVGVDFPAGYGAYNDNTLKAAAENGDALAAAIYGAKQVKAVGNEMFKLDPSIVRDRLQTAEPYLIQGILGGVSGTLQFYFRSAEIQASRSQVRDATTKLMEYKDRSAAVETHARLIIMQNFGSFEERAIAHLALSSELALAQTDDEVLQMRERALALAQQFRSVYVERSLAEQRAENAIAALINVSLRKRAILGAMKCKDGRPLRDVLPKDSGKVLLQRYGFPP